MSIVIVLIYHIWEKSPEIALVLSTLWFFSPLILAVPTFYFFFWWLNAAPIMAGMLIHQMLESNELSHNLWKRVYGAREKIKGLRHDLTAAKESEEKAAGWAALSLTLITLLDDLLHRDG